MVRYGMSDQVEMDNHQKGAFDSTQAEHRVVSLFSYPLPLPPLFLVSNFVLLQT